MGGGGGATSYRKHGEKYGYSSVNYGGVKGQSVKKVIGSYRCRNATKSVRCRPMGEAIEITNNTHQNLPNACRWHDIANKPKPNKYG